MVPLVPCVTEVSLRLSPLKELMAWSCGMARARGACSCAKPCAPRANTPSITACHITKVLFPLLLIPLVSAHPFARTRCCPRRHFQSHCRDPGGAFVCLQPPLPQPLLLLLRRRRSAPLCWRARGTERLALTPVSLFEKVDINSKGWH
jgi:hypothetical protein